MTIYQDAPVCACGHYREVHPCKESGCWDNKQRRVWQLLFGYHFTIMRRCRCKGESK